MSEYGSDDEDDLDLSVGARPKSKSRSDEQKEDGEFDFEEMKSYMADMDRELATTSIGKSFSSAKVNTLT